MAAFRRRSHEEEPLEVNSATTQYRDIAHFSEKILYLIVLWPVFRLPRIAPTFLLLSICLNACMRVDDVVWSVESRLGLISFLSLRLKKFYAYFAQGESNFFERNKTKTFSCNVAKLLWQASIISADILKQFREICRPLFRSFPLKLVM